MRELVASIEKESKKYWGNWGGPGYSGGQLYDKSSFPKKGLLKTPALDPLDELYKTHDLEYFIAKTHPDAKTRKALAQKSDQTFIKNAERLLALPDTLTLPQQIMAIATLLAFRIKLQLSAYNIPQISPHENLLTVKKELKKSQLNTEKTILQNSDPNESIATLTKKIPTTEKTSQKGLGLFSKTLKSLMELTEFETPQLNQTPRALKCYLKAAQLLDEIGFKPKNQERKTPLFLKESPC